MLLRKSGIWYCMTEFLGKCKSLKSKTQVLSAKDLQIWSGLMLQVVISALLIFIGVGCGGPRYVDYFPYHDDGTIKPKVALMPILDSSQNGLSWDISAEISEGIYYELMNSGKYYVVSPNEMGPGGIKSDQMDFFSKEPDLSGFDKTDFIVAMEIIERSITSCNPCTQEIKYYPDNHPCNFIMTMRIRIKIIDIRYCEPRIVLYEVFKTTYSGTEENYDFEDETCWKSSAYSKSYCGRAHKRVIRNLTKRLEEVIWSSK